PTNPIRFIGASDLGTLDTLRNGTGGIARLATLKQRIATEGPVLLVVAGDFVGPSLAARFSGGRQAIEAFNLAGVDYVTLGNHELELAPDSLAQRITESKFKWLSANCTTLDGGRVPGTLAWDTVRVQGTRIGLFGLTMPLESKGFRCGDPDAAARTAIDSLLAAGAEMIVAVSHQPLEADVALLNREGQLDLVLGGQGERATAVASGSRHILKPDANAATVQFVTIWGRKNDWRQAPRLLDVRPNIVPDANVQRVVSAYDDSVAVVLGPNRQVGILVDTLDATPDGLRRREMPIGDLVADAMRAGTGADVALVNAGALRFNDVLVPGPIDRYTLETAFPFADEGRVVVVPLSGSRLRDLLEHGVADGGYGSGGFLQVAGIRFTVDRSRPSGSRIVGQITRTDNRLVTTGETLRVALPSYLACRGGDGYQVAEASAPCAASERAPRLADLLASHVAERLGGRVSRPIEGRITVR
ncbi:MAG TPA: 5'-nucleotidase C-terminal domain-containing protein, partial [Gemmatimonadales bacterium]|nr:5'-nucleotidase C-terminal domain-containing protein [Gemmatimonadales bacterium]